MQDSDKIRTLGCLPFLGLLAAIGCGLALMWHTGPLIVDAWKTGSWVETSGTIIKSSVKQHRRGSVHVYEGELAYKYTVAQSATEAEYESSRYAIGLVGLTALRSRPDHIAEKYTPGQRVNVYYDPNQPENAVLLQGVSWKLAMLLVCEILLILAGTGSFVLGFLKMQRGETEMTLLEAKRQGNRNGQIFTGVIFACAGLAILSLQVIPMTTSAVQSYWWQAVEGNVIEAKVVSSYSSGSGRHGSGGGRTYTANVSYAYTVGNRQYTNDRLWFGDGYSTGWSSGWKAIVNEYKQNPEVTVYYNPANPAVSVLQPGLQWSLLTAWVIGLTMFAGGLIPLTYPRWKNWRESANESGRAGSTGH